MAQARQLKRRFDALMTHCMHHHVLRLYRAHSAWGMHQGCNCREGRKLCIRCVLATRHAEMDGIEQVLLDLRKRACSSASPEFSSLLCLSNGRALLSKMLGAKPRAVR